MSRVARALARQSAAQPGGGGLAQYGLALGLGPTMPRPAEAFQAQFGPMTPIMPFGIDKPKPGQEYAEPRIWEYPVGYNLPTHPGDRKLVSFANLRRYADIYDVARRAIEVRKTEIAALDWDIVVDPHAVKDVGREAFATERAELRRFWRQPDRNYFDLTAWLKAIMEDFLVIDAVSIYPVQARGRGWFGSGVAEFRLIDGATIKPLLDVTGGTPRPPSPAYQQYLWGVPRVDLASMITAGDVEAGEPVGEYTSNELLYLLLNPRSFSPYGFSNTEQAMLTIQTALKRKEWMLSYFDDGSVPSLFVEMPTQADWTPEQIEQRERNLNEVIAATMGGKWKIKFLPPGAKANPMKEPVLSSEFDTLLIETICMAYDVVPMELGFMPKNGLGGKGLSDNQEAVQYRKSLRPTAQFVESVFNRINHHLFNAPEELLFKFVGLDPAEDAERQAARDKTYVSLGAYTIDEVRESGGKEAFGLPETSTPFVLTAQGPVWLDGALARAAVSAAAAQALAARGADQADADPTDEAGADEADDQAEEEPSAQAQQDELKALGVYLTKRRWQPGRAFVGKALSPAQIALASTSPDHLARVQKAVADDASDWRALAALEAGAAGRLAALVAGSTYQTREADTMAALAILTTLYQDAYALGVARWVDADGVTGKAVGPDDGVAAGLAQRQRRYLAGFFDAVGQSVAQIAARAKQYAAGAWHAYQEGFRRAAPHEARWRWETSAKPCRDCSARAGKVYSQATLPGVPADGSTVCRNNCRCRLVPVFPDEPGYDEG